jgi:hypothetical protein
VTTKPQKQRRWHCIFIWVGIVCFLLFVGIPTALVAWTRFQISSALRSASTVRLEEYSFGKTLTSRTLVSAEFRHVTDAVPITLRVGIPGMIAFCFVPHHRVVISDASQHETTFAVCFGCEQMRLSGSGTQATPIAWQRSLRQLFLRHDIPIRDRYTPGFNAEPQ